MVGYRKQGKGGKALGSGLCSRLSWLCKYDPGTERDE